MYFLQKLDKSVLGYGANFGLRKEAVSVGFPGLCQGSPADSPCPLQHLHGDQYSLIGSSGYWAQIALQPFTAFLIVKIPTKVLVTGLIFCWGAFMCGLAGSTK